MLRFLAVPLVWLALSTAPALAACPLISLTPCHGARQPTARPRAGRGILAAWKQQDLRIASLEHRIALLEAALQAQQHQLLRMQVH